jgi:hypothetical protein
MKRSHQAMFERAFGRFYLEFCEAGLPPQMAREQAHDAAWAEYERYCDEKLHGGQDGSQD